MNNNVRTSAEPWLFFVWSEPWVDGIWPWGGRRWCRHDGGLLIPKKKFRERFSLRSAKDSRSVAKKNKIFLWKSWV